VKGGCRLGIATPLGRALGDRYRLDRELGSGGTATVYLAEDLKQRRQVAVKVLKPEVAAVLGPARFLHEIEVAARFTHPHILPLHDSGEADGFLYYVTPYIEGESLRQHLERQKQLPIEEAVRITRQVAGALDYAHRHGVVHRDIKPENILMQEGEPLVADFGLARALAASNAAGLTQTGIILGTPAYMSPEQITGRGDLDERSDLYSLGCVLYEMLAGEPPFAGPPVDAALSRRLTDSPPRVSNVRPMVPPGIDAAVAKALARTPADRFATISRFAEALATALPAAEGPVFVRRIGRPFWLAGAFAALLVIAGLLLRQGGFAFDRGSPATVPRLVVLPFENLGNAEDEYFADGMTDEITARLASLSGLAVIARQSAVRYKGSSKTPQQIGEDLGAAYLLEATVSWQRGSEGRNRIRVRPQLIRASDATHVWADVYDEDLTEVFAVQSRIARSVVEGLGVALLDRERVTLAAAPTRNPEAHDHYLRGLQYANQSEAFNERSYRIAIPLFEKAVALDPTFVHAHAALSRAHAQMYWYAADRSPGRLAIVKETLDRALALDSQLPEVQLAQALYSYARFEHDDALRVLNELLVRQPHHAEATFQVGLVLRRQGKMTEAVAQMEKAVHLSPRSPMIVYNLAETHWLLREHATAERWFERAILFSPDAPSPHSLRARNLVAWQAGTRGAWAALAAADNAGLRNDHRIIHQRISQHVIDRDFDRALAEVESARYEAFDWQFWFVPRSLWLAEIYQMRGEAARARPNYEAARGILEDRVKQFPEDPRYYSSLGIAYAGLGHPAQAVEQASNAVDLVPLTMEAYRGAYAIESLARVYAMIGDRDAAVQRLATLLSTPSHISAALLRVDPRWDPLRGHRGFEELVRQHER